MRRVSVRRTGSRSNAVARGARKLMASDRRGRAFPRIVAFRLFHLHSSHYAAPRTPRRDRFRRSRSWRHIHRAICKRVDPEREFSAHFFAEEVIMPQCVDEPPSWAGSG